jgi:hypothetical protein
VSQPNGMRISCGLGRPRSRETLSYSRRPPQPDSFMRWLAERAFGIASSGALREAQRACQLTSWVVALSSQGSERRGAAREAESSSGWRGAVRLSSFTG